MLLLMLLRDAGMRPCLNREAPQAHETLPYFFCTSRRSAPGGAPQENLAENPAGKPHPHRNSRSILECPPPKVLRKRQQSTLVAFASLSIQQLFRGSGGGPQQRHAEGPSGPRRGLFPVNPLKPGALAFAIYKNGECSSPQEQKPESPKPKAWKPSSQTSATLRAGVKDVFRCMVQMEAQCDNVHWTKNVCWTVTPICTDLPECPPNITELPPRTLSECKNSPFESVDGAIEVRESLPPNIKAPPPPPTRSIKTPKTPKGCLVLAGVLIVCLNKTTSPSSLLRFQA